MHPDARPIDTLTPREMCVIGCVCEGMENVDIGLRLGIATETVKRHLVNIFNKIGVSTRLELAVRCLSVPGINPAEVELLRLELQQAKEQIALLLGALRSADLTQFRDPGTPSSGCSPIRVPGFPASMPRHPPLDEERLR